MSKRFTDTEKWNKRWFRLLSPSDKCLWMYLCDTCDLVGVCEPDFERASFHLNGVVSKETLEKFGDRVEWLPNGKLWIIGYVEFQYRVLDTLCRAHKPVFTLLNKYGLTDRVLHSLSNRVQEKDKEKEKEPEGGAGGNGPPSRMPNTIESLALEAHNVFPGDVSRPSAAVLANVHELLEAGHTPDRLRQVYAWAKKPGDYKPQSPMSLTSPDKFQGWLKKALSTNGDGTGGRVRHKEHVT